MRLWATFFAGRSIVKLYTHWLPRGDQGSNWTCTAVNVVRKRFAEQRPATVHEKLIQRGLSVYFLGHVTSTQLYLHCTRSVYVEVQKVSCCVRTCHWNRMRPHFSIKV